MIGHYLNVQDSAAEDRLLTSVMTPGALYRSNGERCLVGVVEDWTDAKAIRADDPRLNIIRPRLTMWESPHIGFRRLTHIRHPLAESSVFHCYDALCARFGEVRINAAIRNRILSNRAWRTLKPVRELVLVA